MTRSPRLHPTLRGLLEFADSRGDTPLTEMTPVEARAASAERMAALTAPPEEMASISSLQIPGPAGQIPIRLYTPDSPAPRPALVFFHGGGWVIGTLDTYETACRGIASRAGATVVSVDYRLAPEAPFPAAVEDCYAATLWVFQNAPAFHIDPQRISVGGDSAGANLATVVCLKHRDLGPSPYRIASQCMIYPVTNLASFETSSYREFADGYFLTRSLMEWFRDHYVTPEQARDPYASPLHASNLSGLPPALLLTAECDPLRDEGEAYAEQLRAAGVSVKLQRFEGMIHPFLNLSAIVTDAFEAMEAVAAMVRSSSATASSGAAGD